MNEIAMTSASSRLDRMATPTNEELMALAVSVFEYECATEIDYARAVLARWGKSTPSDEELMALAVSVFEYECATEIDYARAVLARWGK